MKWSQSAVKDFEALCPRLAYERHVNGYRSQPNDAQLAGLYFESLCLGKTADGSAVTDMTRLKNGNKSVDQQRIEAQAERFKVMFDPESPEFLGYTIAHRQIEVDGYYGEVAHIDFVTDDAVNGEIIWDLKLTDDLEKDSEFSWKTPEKLDLLQAPTYVVAWMAAGGRDEPRFKYIIFDYSPKMRVKIIDVEIGDQAYEDRAARFIAQKERFAEWSELGEFPRVPTIESCSRCPLECPKRLTKSGIIYQNLKIGS